MIAIFIIPTIISILMFISLCKDNYFLDLDDVFMNAGISLLIWFSVFLISVTIYGKTGKIVEEKVIKEQKIYSIKDNSSISGSWSLFGGSVDEVDYYYFWIETDDGKYRDRIEANDSYIIEEDIEQPYYEEIEHICKHIDGYKMGCLFEKNKYVFHIPEGSIKYEYNLE